jgi:rhodanese-related sulfurtransferase
MNACCGVGSCGKVVAGALVMGMIAFGAGPIHSLCGPIELTLESSPPADTGVPQNGTSQPPPVETNDNGAAPINPGAPSGPVDPAALDVFITVEQAKALYDSGAPFIDTRTREEFEAGHVGEAGVAFHLSTHEWGKPEGDEALDFLLAFKNDPIVLYCGGGTCDASENLAILLKQSGFTKLHIMKDGFPAWRDAGHPTATGGS